MEYLLHIDTSTDTGLVAISANGQVLGSQVNNVSRNHASAINIMTETLLKDTNLSLKDLTGIAVCAGPGSYTGLRIGLATAKGFCYAFDTPLMLDNRLTVLANQAFQQNTKGYSHYVTLLMAREKEFFIAIYDNEFNCTLEPQHIAEEQLDKLIGKTYNIYVITDAPEGTFASHNDRSIRIDTDIKIDLNQWCFYAFKRIKCHNIEILSTAEPFYLKQVYTHK